MKILIAGAEITVKKCYPYEYANARRELRFTIPQSSIAYDNLKELLAANTGEIVLTKDDGTTQTFSGYKFTPEITDKTEDEVAIFYVVIQCVAEAERRALEAKAQVAELSTAVSDMQNKIIMQGETVVGLETASAMQSATIESMLLEAIPFIVETAVYTAVENVLGSILPSAGEDSTDVPEEVTGDVVEEPVDEE